MRPLGEVKVAVDLVRDKIDSCSLKRFSDLPKVVGGEYFSRRIGRTDHDCESCLRREGPLEFLYVERKMFVGRKPVINSVSLGYLHAGVIRRKARVRQQHVVAFI